MRSPAASGPTPDGVPVEMTSPGSSVMTDVTNSTRCPMSNISSRVFDACRKAGIAFLDGVSADNMAARIAAGVRISTGSPQLAELRDAQVA